MQVQSFGISDRGRVREYNEDSFLANQEEEIFLIADGMGGLSKGDVASRIAVESIENFITQSRLEDITWPIKPQEQYTLEENRFLAAISLANWNIYTEFQKDANTMGMGTTITGFLVDGEQLVIANVGDSRSYLFRDDMIEQLTEDHSLVMEEVRKGNMTPEEARNHPQKHVINRALGISESTQVDISMFAPQPGDLYLLCSDGLSDMIPDAEMLSLVRAHGEKSLEELGQIFIDAALEHGGKDNVTLVFVRFYE
ncbi:Stp1/IreP family PP2C-type Ser/Thr phosphatase [Thermodesulfobacteriota bacterium]